MQTAKVYYQNGHQVVILPKEMELGNVKEVLVYQEDKTLVLKPKIEEKNLWDVICQFREQVDLEVLGDVEEIFLKVRSKDTGRDVIL